MTRETKVGLLVGMGAILLIGIIVSDHLSVVQKQQAAESLADLAPQAQRSIRAPGTPVDLSAAPTRQARQAARTRDGQLARESAVPLPEEINRKTTTPAALPMAASIDPKPAQSSESQLLQQLLDQATKTTPAVETLTVQPAVAQPTTVVTTAAEPVVHYVAKGETLWQVANKYYADGSKWEAIKQANPGSVQPNGSVREGVRLVIPNMSNPTPAVTTTVVTTAVSAPATPQNASPSSSSQRTYVIAEGDTLASIARRMLGSEKHWDQIYQANRDQIDDPDRVSVGIRLKIPSAH